MIAALIFAAAAASASAPEPADLRTFTDWTVGCDNGRRCQAAALRPDAGVDAPYLFLSIERDADSAAVALLTIPLEKRTPGSRAILSIDGQEAGSGPVGEGPYLELPIDRPLAIALAKGRTVTLTMAGETVAQASLAGLAATLLYMDEQQHRLGTRGALVRAGSRRDGAVPAPPPLPVIRTPPRGNRPPAAFSDAAARKLVDPEGVECKAAGDFAPQRHRLDPEHTLLLVRTPCWDGAYNFYTELFVIDGRGRVAPAAFDIPTTMDGRFANTLVNAGWDEKTHRLVDFEKARGVGDCGGTGEYAWDGARFRLVEATMMGECRGSTAYITTWRARVEPR